MPDMRVRARRIRTEDLVRLSIIVGAITHSCDTVPFTQTNHVYRPVL